MYDGNDQIDMLTNSKVVFELVAAILKRDHSLSTCKGYMLHCLVIRLNYNCKLFW